jgi:hypothetical protein
MGTWSPRFQAASILDLVREAALLQALEAHNPGHKQPILVDRVIDLPDGPAGIVRGIDRV